ncbi:hypothetical protein CAEBREN_10857 [Caenorhabditis brenneri]|uniref:Uncharacterized protein n=1 Tax=Caenorhabditis brenneri TaxID=135651 RepID=G0PFN5_CAEBE|nr:hypothetical protein CAEBREN_10857 [Caenorhabditis brenneri]
MVNGEEEDPNVRYWKTKYDLLLADYGRTKELAESLETKLLEIVEEHEKREEQKDERIRELEKTVDEANRRIEQLEAACTRSSIDGITRSPEFHAGEHLICEYHKLPILAKNEGFIYGFRWNHENKIHIV